VLGQCGIQPELGLPVQRVRLLPGRAVFPESEASKGLPLPRAPQGLGQLRVQPLRAQAWEVRWALLWRERLRIPGLEPRRPRRQRVRRLRRVEFGRAKRLVRSRQPHEFPPLPAVERPAICREVRADGLRSRGFQARKGERWWEFRPVKRDVKRKWNRIGTFDGGL